VQAREEGEGRQLQAASVHRLELETGPARRKRAGPSL
jgi:putative salt-induced outer membrane protein YdiY